jgi:type I restriction enzyme M protein
VITPITGDEGHPSASERELIQPMADQEQHDDFLGGLEALGGSAGNGKLRVLLGWNEARYDTVKAALIEKGMVVPG